MADLEPVSNSPDDPPSDGVPILLPDFGQADRPVRLCGWLVETGEAVTAGEPIAELLIPGLLYELNAPGSGRLRITQPSGDGGLTVGTCLGWVQPESNESGEAPGDH